MDIGPTPADSMAESGGPGTIAGVAARRRVALPSGHDGWTVGDEPAVVVDFQGMIDYARASEPRGGQRATGPTAALTALAISPARRSPDR